MAGRCLGSALRSLIRPRLATSTRPTSTVIARWAGSARPWLTYGAGSTCSCRSGAGRPASEWAKPPDSAVLLVSGPRWVSCQRSVAARPAFSHRPRSRGVDQMTGSTGWSLRFAPTPRLSATTSMPISIRCSAGPTPDSISS